MSGRDSSRPKQASASSSLVLLLVVLLGAAGWLREAGVARDGGVRVPASGPFWSVRDAADQVLELPIEGPGLPLHPGQVFWLDADPSAERRYTDLTFQFGPGGDQSAYMVLRFGDNSATNFRFVFLPSPRAGYLVSRTGGGPWTELARGQVAVAPGAEPADSRSPCDLGLRLLPDGIETTWNGHPLVRATTPVAPVAPRLSLWADGVRLLSVRAAGQTSAEAGDGSRAFAFTDDFASLASGDARRRQRLQAALALGGAVVLAALYLRSRCRLKPPGRSLLHATLLLLAPASVPFAVDAFHPLPGFAARAAVAVLALPGLLLALWSLRAFGPLGVTPDSAGSGGDARAAAAPASRGLASGLRATPVVLALAGVTALAASGATGGRAERAWRDSQRWLHLLDTERFTLAAPLRLDAGNALPIPGVRRDLDLSARAMLSPDGLLELRVHSPEDQAVAGLALCLRAGDAAASGFFIETSYEFRRVGSWQGAAPSGTPFELQLRLRGEHVEARIDGRLVAAADNDEFPVGRTFVLAGAGTAQIERLELQPVAEDMQPPRPGRARVVAALGAAGLLLLLALLARALLAQSVSVALPTLVFALVPLALGLHSADADGRLGFTAAAAACAGTALLLSLHAPSLGLAAGAVRTSSFVLLATAASAGALVIAIDLAPREPPVNAVRPHVFPGPRLSPDLVAFQHPALRRLNTWLREHRFRSHSFTMEKPAGTLRVVAVGSSSTFGHGVPEESGLDYPTQLQALLAERLPGLPVQVINGAIPGSSSASSLRFFREVLLRFQPDVVTVCFAFNDAYHVTQLDEDRFLERCTRPDYHHGQVESAVLDEVFAGKQRLDRLLQLFTTHPGPTLPLWEHVLAELPEAEGERTPPERFASNLRAYAQLCAERGVHLVLIKEPFRDDPPRIWKDEFYAAIDAVGAEFGLPVLDPRPALAAQGGGVLFIDEIHPAPGGHSVLAHELLPLVAPLLEARIGAGH